VRAEFRASPFALPLLLAEGLQELFATEANPGHPCFRIHLEDSVLDLIPVEEAVSSESFDALVRGQELEDAVLTNIMAVRKILLPSQGLALLQETHEALLVKAFLGTEHKDGRDRPQALLSQKWL
jgi:hypothetical protein